MQKYMELENMDSYYEQAVKRQIPPKSMFGLLGGLALTIGLMVLSIFMSFSAQFTWMFPVAVIMIILGIYIIYYLLKNTRVEYEYTFVVGELRIARIKGRTKRRTITYFDVKSIDDIGRFIDPKTGKKNIDTSKYPNTLHAAVNDRSPETYYMIIHDKTRQKPAVLLLTPDDRILEMIKPYFSVALKKKFFEIKKQEQRSSKVSSAAADTAQQTKEEAKPETEKKPEPKAEATPETEKKPEPKAEAKPAAEKKPEAKQQSASQAQKKSQGSKKKGKGKK